MALLSNHVAALAREGVGIAKIMISIASRGALDCHVVRPTAKDPPRFRGDLQGDVSLIDRWGRFVREHLVI